MATVIKTIPVQETPEAVWDALRDVGAVHTRIAPGFVTATELVPGGRRLTFANGQTITETIITVDDQHHRLVWSTQGNVTTHYNASAEVTMDEDGGSIVTWTADFLPDSAAATVDGLMTGVAQALVRTFELVEES